RSGPPRSRRIPADAGEQTGEQGNAHQGNGELLVGAQILELPGNRLQRALSPLPKPGCDLLVRQTHRERPTGKRRRRRLSRRDLTFVRSFAWRSGNGFRNIARECTDTSLLGTVCLTGRSGGELSRFEAAGARGLYRSRRYRGRRLIRTLELLCLGV